MPRARVPADVRTYLLASDGNEAADVYQANSDAASGRLWLGFVENVNLPILTKLLPGAVPDCSRCRRALWAAVLVACTAFGIYQIASQVILHSSHPVNAVFDTVEADDPDGAALEFPAVTICNSNYLRKSALERGDGAVLRDLFHKGAAYRDSFASVTNFSNEDWLRLYDRVQHNIEAMVVKCTWMAKPCSARDFVVTYTDMGRCYTFNSPESPSDIRRVTASGADYGLKLVLNAQVDEYIFSVSDPGLGFKVFVHNQSDALPSMSSLGTSVGVGFITNVEITLQKVQLLSPPHGTCTIASQLPTLKYPVYRTGKPAPYTEKSCKWECLTDCVVRHCRCKDFYYPTTGVSICEPHRTRSCVRPRFRECATSASGCSHPVCPQTCEQFKYSTTLHAMPLSDVFYDQVNEFIDDTKLFSAQATKEHDSAYWKQNTALLNVYFAALSYESLQHTPAYPAMQLFCDIGGALGLLLGATLLTAIEIIDYFIVHYAPKLL